MLLTYVKTIIYTCGSSVFTAAKYKCLCVITYVPVCCETQVSIINSNAPHNTSETNYCNCLFSDIINHFKC